MDIVTQGLLGGSLALAFAKPKHSRMAAGIGFAAALLADADVLIKSSSDPLLQIEFHRHFSHALAFIPIGALIASLLLWAPLRKRLEFNWIYLYAMLGYATAGLLDACTSYGTHLLWPFSDERFAWSIIAIIDPVFSLILLAALIFACKNFQPPTARAGIVFAGAYLLFGFLQHHGAQQQALELAQQRGHEVNRLIVKPTMGNLVLWRSIYETDGSFHIDALRVGLFGDKRVYPGTSVPRFELQRDQPRLPPDSVVARDIERFASLSDDYIVADPERENVLIDVRYSMLPIQVAPMWGIDLNVESPGDHARFRVYRDRPPNARELFLAMLLGRDLPG